MSGVKTPLAERDRLKVATDELTDLLDDAETFFASRNRFVAATVPMGDTGVHLSWERRADGWRLAIGAKTIDQANRAGRILAALHLGALLGQLETNEASLSQDLATAIENARLFVQAHAAQGTGRERGEGDR